MNSMHPLSDEASDSATQAEAESFARTLAPIVADNKARGDTTVRAVANALNARDIPSREGGRWHLRSTGLLLRRLGVVRPDYIDG